MLEPVVYKKKPPGGAAGKLFLRVARSGGSRLAVADDAVNQDTEE